MKSENEKVTKLLQMINSKYEDMEKQYKELSNLVDQDKIKEVRVMNSILVDSIKLLEDLTLNLDGIIKTTIEDISHRRRPQIIIKPEYENIVIPNIDFIYGKLYEVLDKLNKKYSNIDLKKEENQIIYKYSQQIKSDLIKFLRNR